jgi:hypothetical protein
MLTGQRVEEIARLHVDQWDATGRIIDWSKTKNYQPHAVPVPSLAAELIESIKPNEFGWFFPSRRPHRSRSATARSTVSSGDSVTAASSLMQPIATCGGHSRPWPAKRAFPRRYGTAFRTMRCRTSAPRITTVGTTCREARRQDALGQVRPRAPEKEKRQQHVEDSCVSRHLLFLVGTRVIGQAARIRS